jgi:hypothetical protein
MRLTALKTTPALKEASMIPIKEENQALLKETTSKVVWK